MASFSDLLNFTRSSVGYYFDSSGNIVSAAINEPRFNHTALSGRSPGLLIEPSVTELNTRTKADSTNWTNIGCTLTDLTLNAMGQFPGLRVAATVASSNRVRIPTMASTNGENRLVEVYYRPGTSGRIRVQFTNNTNGNNSTYTAAIGGSSSITSTAGVITLVSDSLTRDGVTRRLRLKFVPNADAASLFIAVGPDSAVAGEDIIVLALFTQIATVFTTPILTSGSTVTRAADVASVKQAATWFDNTAGTFVGDFRFSYEDTDIGDQVVFFRLNSGSYTSLGHSCHLGTLSTATGRMNYRLETATGVTTVLGTTTDFASGLDQTAKVGISYNTTNAKLCWNGGTVYSGVPVGTLPDMTAYDMVLGGTAPITVLSLTYRPNLVSNATLQAMTT